MLREEQIIIPFDPVFELHPRANGGVIVYDYRQTFPVSNNIMMTRHKVETDKILLTINKI